MSVRDPQPGTQDNLPQTSADETQVSKSDTMIIERLPPAGIEINRDVPKEVDRNISELLGICKLIDVRVNKLISQPTPHNYISDILRGLNLTSVNDLTEEQRTIVFQNAESFYKKLILTELGVYHVSIQQQRRKRQLYEPMPHDRTVMHGVDNVDGDVSKALSTGKKQKTNEIPEDERLINDRHATSTNYMRGSEKNSNEENRSIMSNGSVMAYHRPPELNRKSSLSNMPGLTRQVHNEDEIMEKKKAALLERKSFSQSGQTNVIKENPPVEMTEQRMKGVEILDEKEKNARNSWAERRSSNEMTTLSENPSSNKTRGMPSSTNEIQSRHSSLQQFSRVHQAINSLLEANAESSSSLERKEPSQISGTVDQNGNVKRTLRNTPSPTQIGSFSEKDRPHSQEGISDKYFVEKTHRKSLSELSQKHSSSLKERHRDYEFNSLDKRDRSRSYSPVRCSLHQKRNSSGYELNESPSDRCGDKEIGSSPEQKFKSKYNNMVASSPDQTSMSYNGKYSSPDQRGKMAENKRSLSPDQRSKSIYNKRSLSPSQKLKTSHNRRSGSPNDRPRNSSKSNHEDESPRSNHYEYWMPSQHVDYPDKESAVIWKNTRIIDDLVRDKISRKVLEMYDYFDTVSQLDFKIMFNEMFSGDLAIGYRFILKVTMENLTGFYYKGQYSTWHRGYYYFNKDILDFDTIKRKDLLLSIQRLSYIFPCVDKNPYGVRRVAFFRGRWNSVCTFISFDTFLDQWAKHFKRKSEGPALEMGFWDWLMTGHFINYIDLPGDVARQQLDNRWRKYQRERCQHWELEVRRIMNGVMQNEVKNNKNSQDRKKTSYDDQMSPSEHQQMKKFYEHMQLESVDDDSQEATQIPVQRQMASDSIGNEREDEQVQNDMQLDYRESDKQTYEQEHIQQKQLPKSQGHHVDHSDQENREMFNASKADVFSEDGEIVSDNQHDVKKRKKLGKFRETCIEEIEGHNTESMSKQGSEIPNTLRIQSEPATIYINLVDEEEDFLSRKGEDVPKSMKKKTSNTGITSENSHEPFLNRENSVEFVDAVYTFGKDNVSDDDDDAPVSFEFLTERSKGIKKFKKAAILAKNSQILTGIEVNSNANPMHNTVA